MLSLAMPAWQQLGNKAMQTHETYIAAVHSAAKAMIVEKVEAASFNLEAIAKGKSTKQQKANLSEYWQVELETNTAKLNKLNKVKVVYGIGHQQGLRGVTYFNKWKNGEDQVDLVEVCAFGQSDWTQVAGTTIHELAHVIAGPMAGHGKEWKDACKELGLRVPKAVGHTYRLSGFEPKIRQAITATALPTDGTPMSIASQLGILGMLPKEKPCSVGIGTRGGTSRGIGSGSRLKKCECPDCGYTVRVTQKWIDIGLPICPTDKVDMIEA